MAIMLGLFLYLNFVYDGHFVLLGQVAHLHCARHVIGRTRLRIVLQKKYSFLIGQTGHMNGWPRIRIGLPKKYSFLIGQTGHVIGWPRFRTGLPKIPRFRIRIHLIRIRIRIQHFRLNTDPDPGFLWSKIGKNLQLNNFFFFLGQKLRFTYP